MDNVFNNVEKIKRLDLSNFDTTNVINMEKMFRNTSSLETLILGENFKTNNVKSMNSMFCGATSIENFDFIKNFDTSQTTNMLNMFKGMNIESLDLSNFDTSKVTNMNGMFNGMTNLTTIKVSNKFVTTSVTESTDMFASSTNLVGGAGTTYDANHIDKTYARVDDPTNGNPGYFTLKNQ